MEEKYKIEIHDVTTKSTTVYQTEGNSFYEVFLIARAIQRNKKYLLSHTTEIMRIEKYSK